MPKVTLTRRVREAPMIDPTKDHYRGQKQQDKKGDHRCTPPEIYDPCLLAAHLVEFDLDVATNDFASIPVVTQFMGRGPDDDGLQRQWWGNVWLNPPFSALYVWALRLISQVDNCRSITFLGPCDASTAWWHLLVRHCDAWATPDQRYHFPVEGEPTGSPPGAIVLFYFGPGATHWVRTMREHGFVAYFGHPVE